MKVSYNWHRRSVFTCAIPVVLKLIKKYVGHPENLSILDLGCGTGELCAALQSAGCRAIGIEPDAKGHAIACKRHPQVNFLQASVYDDVTQTLGGKTYDCLVSIEVIEHLFSPQYLPLFAQQALKPGGWLIISTPYHGYLKNLVWSLINYWDTHHTALWEGGHIKFFSRKTLSKLLRQHHFEPVAFHGLRRLPFLWSSMIIIAKKHDPTT